MDIAISFGAGVPVLTLAGRVDGAAAVVFDEQRCVETETARWVIDFTGASYLSSLGVRSLVCPETRLKATRHAGRNRACLRLDSRSIRALTNGMP